QVELATLNADTVPVQPVLEGDTRRYSPTVDLLEKAQDRLLAKQLYQSLDIPTPPFAPVDSLADLRAAVEEIGLPAVLKTRRLGYDGKGQREIGRASCRVGVQYR